MGCLLAVALAATLALAAGSAAASTSAYNTVPCWTWNESGSFAVLKAKPRECTLGGRYGYQQADLVKMRWRSWSGGSAFGRGVSVGNMLHPSPFQLQRTRLGPTSRASNQLRAPTAVRRTSAEITAASRDERRRGALEPKRCADRDQDVGDLNGV
jgi:hypothetical protein